MATYIFSNVLFIFIDGYIPIVSQRRILYAQFTIRYTFSTTIDYSYAFEEIKLNVEEAGKLFAHKK